MAFTVPVPQYILEASTQCRDAGTMGSRHDGTDGNQDQQLIGIIGQNMINVAIGRALMVPNTGFDGGVDFTVFGLKFDVKTIGRTVPPRINYINNLALSQTKFDVDGYLFMSFDKSCHRISVCGWLPKETFLERAVLYPSGTVRRRSDNSTFVMRADTLEIENKDLYHRAINWPELFLEFHTISVKGYE